jgi:hypothetical protein
MEADGKGKLAALRMWELETINGLGWNEADWVQLPLDERYRKVTAHKLSDWMGALEARESMRKMRLNSGSVTR